MYHLHLPSAVLADYVDCFWESDFGGMGEGVYHELYTAQYQPNLIFNLSAGYLRDGCAVARAEAVTVNTQAIRFAHGAANRLFGIRFRVGGLRLFSGLALHEMADEVLCPSDILGRWHGILAERVWDCQTTAERIAVAEAYLLEQLDERLVERFRLVRHVHGHLRSTCRAPGCIGRLAAQTFLTQRSIDRYYKEFVGLSPKAASRMERFGQAFSALHPSPDNFDFHDFGYYDSAHFSKEFRAFTGLCMREYLRSPFFVQNLQSGH